MLSAYMTYLQQSTQCVEHTLSCPVALSSLPTKQLLASMTRGLTSAPFNSLYTITLPHAHHHHHLVNQ
jgi:hypothetical protein